MLSYAVICGNGLKTQRETRPNQKTDICFQLRRAVYGEAHCLAYSLISNKDWIA